MNKDLILGLVLTLAITSIMTVPVLATKGASKGQDITWVVGTTTYKAIFYITGSGIIHQWRYEPNIRHYIYLPEAEFPNMPQGEGWGIGTWAGITNGKSALFPIFGPPSSARWWWR